MGVMEKFRLDGKVAWITGASYGLGMAYAKAYAEAGAKIVFNDVNPDNFARGMEEYKKAGIDAYGAICDVTKEDQVEKFVKDVEANVGPIDIQQYGLSRPGRIEGKRLGIGSAASWIKPGRRTAFGLRIPRFFNDEIIRKGYRRSVRLRSPKEPAAAFGAGPVKIERYSLHINLLFLKNIESTALVVIIPFSGSKM